MIWPFTRSRNGVKKPEGPTPEEVEAEEVEEAVSRNREKRREEAQEQLVLNMREAREARQATISSEAEHVKATHDRRKKAETTIRQAQEKATEISDTISPLGPVPKPEEAGA